MSKWGLDFLKSMRDGTASSPPPPFAAHLNLRQSVRVEEFEEGRVVLNWIVQKHFTLPDGIVQGGLLCAIADMSQTFALFSMLDAYEVWPTLDFHIRFIRPIRFDDVVRVESNVVNRGKTNAVVETTFENSERKVLARVTGGWAKAGRERTW
jgi:uncharacterized protein (TIGR00369 family)